MERGNRGRGGRTWRSGPNGEENLGGGAVWGGGDGVFLRLNLVMGRGIGRKTEGGGFGLVDRQRSWPSRGFAATL